MPGKFYFDELVIVKARGGANRQEARIDSYNVSEKTYRVRYNEGSYEWVREPDITRPG